MTTPPNRHGRRQAAARARKGKTIKPLSPAALRAEADRVLSRTQLSAITQTAQPLSGDEGAELGRCFAELGSAIAASPDGSAEHRELVAKRVAVVNVLLNGGRYADTVERHIQYLMADDPGPTRPAPPNDANHRDRWKSAPVRYFEQTFLAHGLTEACAPILGPVRANALTLELLSARNGDPYRMLQPAQTRAAASDSLNRNAMQRMAARRWAFDAVVEDVTRTEILRRANGPGGANLIEPDTLEHWRRDAGKQELALDEQLALQVRKGTKASLPPALQIRLLQLTRYTFQEWLQLALRRG